MWGAVPSAKNAFLCTSDQSTIFGFQPTQFSIGLAFDGESLWVGDLATNSVLVRSWTRNQTIPGVFSPMGIAFDGSDMWVANSGNNTVTRIRASDGVPIASYTTGQNPWGVAFDGANVWVTNSVSNTVSKF